MTLDPEVLQAATILARAHQSPQIVFWLAPDWTQTYGVRCARKDPETVTLSVFDLGRGYLTAP